MSCLATWMDGRTDELNKQEEIRPVFKAGLMLQQWFVVDIYKYIDVQRLAQFPKDGVI